MTIRQRIAASASLMVAAWVVLITGWPSVPAACAAGLLALMAALLAPI